MWQYQELRTRKILRLHPVQEHTIQKLKESKKDHAALKLEQEWDQKCNFHKLLDLVHMTFVKCKIGNSHFLNKTGQRRLTKMILDQDNMISLQLSQVCHIMIFQFRNWEKANFNKDDFFLFSFIFFSILIFYYFLFDRHIKNQFPNY